MLRRREVVGRSWVENREGMHAPDVTALRTHPSLILDRPALHRRFAVVMLHRGDQRRRLRRTAQRAASPEPAAVQAEMQPFRLAHGSSGMTCLESWAFASSYMSYEGVFVPNHSVTFRSLVADHRVHEALGHVLVSNMDALTQAVVSGDETDDEWL